VSHAVVIEECLPDKFLIKDSSQASSITEIPKNRKTFYQHDIASQGPPRQQNNTRKDFEQICAQSIRWNQNDWILLDEGFGLKFHLY